MNLYQAGYYRRGKQGSGAGWGIVSPSKGMSQIAKEGFKGIAAKLVELKSVGVVPVLNTGIFLYDKFVYLMQVNYAAKGEDARGVAFVHGYCFNTTDYFELCSNPSILCGASEENFRMEYDASVAAYPVAAGLSCENYDFGSLFSKYRLDDEKYKKLIFGAINAIENYSNPLCIKLDLPSEQYMQTSKELLYLIMMGLPYHLRIKVSFFSYGGSGAAIYLSDQTQGNNYVDLESGVFAVDSTRLASFYFTKIYNTVPAIDYQKRDEYFKSIAQFINAAFENPLRDTGCTQVEAGFQAKIKKNDEEGILPEMAGELLTAFLRNSLTESEEVYQYLTALLKVMNDNSLFVPEEKLRKHILDRYEKTNAEDYRREACRLNAREILNKEQKKGFEELNRLSVSSKEQFASVLAEISKQNIDYYTKYYLEIFLPFSLTSLDKLNHHFAPDKRIEKGEYAVLLTVLDRLMADEMHRAHEYDELLGTQRYVKAILRKFPKSMEKEIDDVWVHTHFILWNCMQVSDFRTEAIREYRELKLEEIAENGWGGEECPNAGKFVRLSEVFEKTDGEELIPKLYNLLLADEAFASVADRKYIQELFYLDKLESLDFEKAWGFDGLLAVFYDFREKKFDTLSLVKKLSQKNQNALEPSCISKVLRHSYFLRNKKLRENLIESLTEDIRALKGDEGAHDSKMLIKGLKRYRDILCGKKVKGDIELEEMQRCANTFHRLFVGALVLFTIAFLLRELNSCEGFRGFNTILTGGVFGLLSLILTGVKMYLTERDGGLMECCGMTRIPAAVVYFILAVLLLAGMGGILLLANKKIMIIGIFIYSFLATASAILYSILAED